MNKSEFQLRKPADSEQPAQGELNSRPTNVEVHRGRLTVGTSASGRDIAIPYLVRRGRGDGPCLWVNAAVHGDEVNGTIASLDFFESLADRQISGTVVVTPVANVLALDERRKATGVDSLDMDQSFPGRPDGFITERLAAKLFAEFGVKADVVVNLHTLGAPFDAMPYAVYKLHPDAALSETELLRHIALFDPTVACRMPVENAGGELPGNISGALDYQSLAGKAVAFMIELGGGGRLQRPIIKHGVDGLLRLAGHIGILEDAPFIERSRRVVRVTRRAHKLVQNGGFYEPEVVPGKSIPARTRLGFVRNVFGEVVEEIYCQEETWVLAVRRDPVVHTGDRIAFLATSWDEVDVS
jgi:uncharacterized protein